MFDTKLKYSSFIWLFSIKSMSKSNHFSFKLLLFRFINDIIFLLKPFVLFNSIIKSSSNEQSSKKTLFKSSIFNNIKSTRFLYKVLLTFTKFNLSQNKLINFNQKRLQYSSFE